MSGPNLRDLCEAYLLGHLDAEERARVDGLLARQDPECVAAMREASDFVANLAALAPDVEPPALLRSRLLNVIRAEAPRRRGLAGMAIPWAIAAGLAMVAFTQYRSATEGARQLAAARAEIVQLARDNQRQKEILAVVLAGDSRLIPIGASSREPVFRAFWSGPRGIVLAGENVPAPAEGRAMQLWVVPKSGNPVSAGVFAPDADGTVLLVASGQLPARDQAAALAISDEPAGGSPQPTTTPAYVGPIGD
ncbi:MAG: anti-sigma factor [Bryobacteraceae bacterium]